MYNKKIKNKLKVKKIRKELINNNMSESKNHQLRLSVDVRSIKDHQFTAQLYLKYIAIPSLGIKSFRTSPTISVNNPKAEFNLSASCFTSGYFEAGPGEVENKLSEVLKI